MGLVLDVKVICHLVHGIGIQIPSTSGDKTKVWVVISRSSIRFVDELRHRVSENLPEEVAQECMQDKEQSQNLPVNWHDMSSREKERQMWQFIGNS